MMLAVVLFLIEASPVLDSVSYLVWIVFPNARIEDSSWKTSDNSQATRKQQIDRLRTQNPPTMAK